MSGKVRVKFIADDKHGFVKGNIYDGYLIKSQVPHKDEIISVMDKHGDEYAYPKSWFEIVSQEN